LPNYSIKRIKDISFVINEHLFINDSQRVIKIELGHTLGFNIENNAVNFTIRLYFHYQDQPSDNILAEIFVQNIFEVENLRNFLRPEGIFLPTQILIAIVSMSISHGRALFTKNLAGTVFQEIMLPISNPVEITKHFYPKMFNSIEESPLK
jgi:hypothetical protein